MKNLYNKILNEVYLIQDFDSWDNSSSEFKQVIQANLNKAPIHLDFNTPGETTPRLWKTIRKFSTNYNKNAKKIFDLFYKELIASGKFPVEYLYGNSALYDLGMYMIAANVSYIASKPVTHIELLYWLNRLCNIEAYEQDCWATGSFPDPCWWMDINSDDNSEDYIYFPAYTGWIKSFPTNSNREWNIVEAIIYNFARLAATLDQNGTEYCPGWMINEMSDLNDGTDMNLIAMIYLQDILGVSSSEMSKKWWDNTPWDDGILGSGDTVEELIPLLWDFAKRHSDLLL